MKQGTIKYSQEFISPTGLKRWVGMEYPVDFDSEDYLKVYQNVAKMVETCGLQPENGANYMPGQQGPPAIVADKPIPEDQRIAAIIADIYSCKELKVLESYRLMVKGNRRLQAAYDEMFKNLSQPIIANV